MQSTSGAGGDVDVVWRPESVLRRIEKLREYRRDLRGWKNLAYEQYVKERQTRHAAERVLHLATEAILDILDHVLSSRFDVVSDSYEEIINNARLHGVVSDRLGSELSGLGGFRNVLAHDYLGISNEEVFRHLEKMNRIMDTVVAELERLVEADG